MRDNTGRRGRVSAIEKILTHRGEWVTRITVRLGAVKTTVDARTFERAFWLDTDLAANAASTMEGP